MAEWWFHKQGYCSSEILRCDIHIDDVQNFQNFDRIKYPLTLCSSFSSFIKEHLTIEKHLQIILAWQVDF